MGKKSGGSAPSVDPRVGAAMEKQANLLEQQQNWYQNEIYPWMQAQAAKQNKWAEEDRANALDQAQWWQDLAQKQYDKQNEQSDFYFNHYKNDILPIERSLIADAKNYNTSAEAERQAQAALGDYRTAYANQRRQQNMSMQQYGIDPTSGAYQSQNRAMDLNQAAMSAAAANQARSAAEALGWEKKLAVTNLGQQYINNANNATQLGNAAASTYGSGATSALGNANTYGQQGLSNLGALANVGLNSYSSLVNGWGSYGNQAMNVSNYNLNAYQAQQAAKQNALNGFWNRFQTFSNIADAWVGPTSFQRIGQGFGGIMGGIGRAG